MRKWIWKKILQPFLSLFLKSKCPICDRPAKSELCLYCERQLFRCQFPGGGYQFPAEVPVFVWGEYKGSLKRAIAALKYNDNPELAKPLGYWLAEAWLNSPQSVVDRAIVVPIPMHQKKLKERGFNQAELLAKSFCQLTGLPLQRKGLERIKETEALYGLSKEKRQETVKDAFLLGKAFRRRRVKRSVLLVDDIYTTGSTVNVAIATLKKAGIKVAGVLAIATTHKPNKSNLSHPLD